MVDFEEQKYRVVKTEGTLRTDLDEMSGQEVYALIRTRLGEERAEAVRLELDEKGSASVLYKESFGQDAQFNIQRAGKK